jgi:hypothetical protein
VPLYDLRTTKVAEGKERGLEKAAGFKHKKEKRRNNKTY